MTRDELVEAFRQSGRHGVALFDFLEQLPEATAVLAVELAELLVVAYSEGVDEYVEAEWTTRWTTAPVALDAFRTRSVTVGEYGHAPLRRVKIDPLHLEKQLALYASAGAVLDEEQLRRGRAQGTVTYRETALGTVI